MSYILDALKKSEQERKLGHLPGLSSDHLPLQRQDNTALIIKLSILMGLLLVSFLLILIYLYFDKNTATIQQSQNNISRYEKQTIQNPRHLDLTNTVQQDFLDSDTNSFDKRLPAPDSQMEIIHPSKARREQLIKQKQTQQNQDEALKKKYEEYFQSTEDKPVQTPQKEIVQESIQEGAKRRMQEAIQTSSQTSSAQDSGQATTQDPEQKTIQETTTDYEREAKNLEAANEEKPQQMHWEDYPSIAELSPDIQEQLPALHVSTHIFSSAESFRKVTINNQGAKKGAELSRGLLLQDITEEGVILSFEDIWFRMKALENWQN